MSFACSKSVRVFVRNFFPCVSERLQHRRESCFVGRLDDDNKTTSPIFSAQRERYCCFFFCNSTVWLCIARRKQQQQLVGKGLCLPSSLSGHGERFFRIQNGSAPAVFSHERDVKNQRTTNDEVVLIDSDPQEESRNP